MTRRFGTLLSVLLIALVFPSLGTKAQAIRTGMTWTVLGQSGGYVRVGSDGQTNPYSGDTTIDRPAAILCLRTDASAPPAGISFTAYEGWARGSVRATPPIPGVVLTSRAMGDEICDDTFGPGWRLAEFHDGRYGAGFAQAGGWSFWAAGTVPAGTRLWAAISDQPANPWNSAGSIPTIPMPKYLPSEAPVPDRYVVMFPESTPAGDVDYLAQSLVSQYGGTLLDTFTAVQGFSFNGSNAQAQAMSLDARVESVEQDTYGQEAQAPWHLDRVDQRNRPLDGIYAPINRGTNVNIYILDTGFRRSHQEFGGRATQAVDFIRFIGERDDCNGHGTQVGSVAAGATVGVAPGANLISVRVAGCKGNAYNPVVSVLNSTIVAGLDWVARNHTKPAVANVSYGFPAGFWRRWFRWRSPMDRAVKRAVNAGVTVVVAAGQPEGGGGAKNADRYSPARAAEAITVSGVDQNDRRPDTYFYGKVDMFAPGVDVRAADFHTDNDYRDVDGTSFSSPMVAGAAALFLETNPAATPADVRRALQDGATQGVVVSPGPGSANRLLFVNVVRQGTHAGLTWSSREQRAGGLVRVGNDTQSNPYVGDTAASQARPILCLLIDGSPVPAGIVPDMYNGWARGRVRLGPAVLGSQLGSRAAADAVCATNFGAGWRMAEFHDGRYGPGLSSTGGWSFWAFGTIPVGTRFWTAINDQPANPWN